MPAILLAVVMDKRANYGSHIREGYRFVTFGQDMSVRNERGFTLFELMIAIVVMSLAMAFAVPNFIDLMARNRDSAAAVEAANSLQLARNIAVTKRQNVVLVPNSTGWNLYLGTATGTLLAQHTLDPRVTLTAYQGGVLTAGINEITFEPTGRIEKTQPTPVAFLDMTLRICDSASKRELGKQLTMNWMGRINVTDFPDTTTCNP
ncbi:MAG TPA: GspH/FimT family pseudopilin [Moraxellaceae bacterium]|nr:GspH/FimT family pseudopilin [Moraxellaceae bacterium]